MKEFAEPRSGPSAFKPSSIASCELNSAPNRIRPRRKGREKTKLKKKLGLWRWRGRVNERLGERASERGRKRRKRSAVGREQSVNVLQPTYPVHLHRLSTVTRYINPQYPVTATVCPLACRREGGPYRSLILDVS